MIIQPLARLGVTPNTLTIVGLLLSVVAALVIAQGYMLVGGLLVLFAGVFDMFDGAIARVRNATTTFGAFLDSTLDRYSESIILFGLLAYALQHPGLQDVLWPASHEQTWMIIFIFVAAVGSLMVSYTKARAEGLGIECKTGLLARPERVVILAIGLLSNTGIWALALLAVLSHVTAMERIIVVWHGVHSEHTMHNAPAALDTREQGRDYRQDAGQDNLHLPTVLGPNEAQGSDIHSVSTSAPPFSGGIQ
ncbi:MAG: hypothetical protein NVS2B12_09440 [Ktedonobacteraceae bacterium]